MTSDAPHIHSDAGPGTSGAPDPGFALFCFPAEDLGRHAPLADAGLPGLRPYDRDSLLEAAGRGETCVILWQSPAQTLIHALESGERPGQALTRWQAGVAELLDLFRRNRRQILLVESDILSRPEAGDERARLASRLGLPAPLPALPDEPHPSVTTLLATLAPAALDSLQATLAELRASSLTRPDEGLALDALDQAAQELAAQAAALQQARDLAEQGRQALARATEAHAEERALLLAQMGQTDLALQDLDRALHQERGRAGRLEHELAALQQQHETLGSALLRARTDLAGLETACSATQDLADAARQESELLFTQLAVTEAATLDEVRRLTAQLVQSRAAVDQLVVAEQAIQAQLAQTRAAEGSAWEMVAQVQGQLAQTRAAEAKAWAMVAHMQAQLADSQDAEQRACAESTLWQAQIATNLAAAEAASAEIDRLSRALAGAEQALARALGETRAEAEARVQTEETLAALHRELAGEQALARAETDRAAALEQQLGALEQQLGALEQERAALHGEIARIMSSASIRMTEPLRATRRLMQRLGIGRR